MSAAGESVLGSLAGQRKAMSDTRRITVTLPTPLAEAVQTAVESGSYSTTSEVVRDAVALWHEQVAAREVEALRRLWDEGKASGQPRPFSIDTIVARVSDGSKKKSRA